MAMRMAHVMTSEFVTNGHPDKVCDQMADTIVGAAIEQDPKSRVAMEVTGGHGLVHVTGEMTTRAQFDIGELLRQTYKEIGHDHPIAVTTNVVRQAPDIAQGVDREGAGDQGIMTGYAIAGDPSFMPRVWVLARTLCQRLRFCRDNGILPYLKPDGKSQVTMINGKVTHVTLAAHHAEDVDLITLRHDLAKHVVGNVLPDFSVVLDSCDPKNPIPDANTVINGTDRFVEGGFDADAGTTGRKLVVDNYGPNVEIGGGCYSGKDPSKVDRSGAYFCRLIAKSIVVGRHAGEALVKVGYAIGVAKPTFVSVETDLPEMANHALTLRILAQFDFRPLAIIERLKLQNPRGWRYRDTAEAGHYGNIAFPWEHVVAIR